MRASPRRTQLFSLRDFTGGLNLVSDTFRLADNESPDMLNVDIDRRGGFQVRRGIEPYSEDPLAGDPETLWNYNGYGTMYTFAQVASEIYRSTGAGWVAVGSGLGSGTSDVCPVTFNNNNYWVRGNANPVKWDTSTATSLTSAFNDTTTPTSGNVPRADHMAVHSGYLWVAGTWESGTHYPNRVRWSWANTFDNSGENWRTDDYIDIDDGKDADSITAIVPFGDQLIVFKRDSVYAVYGYSSESFSIVNISNTVGAVSHSAVLATPAGLFFFDHHVGLNVYNGRSVQWVFEQIWPAMRDGSIPKTRINDVQIGWVENRLWVSVPWFNIESPTGYTFVYDPFVKQRGAWTKFDLAINTYCRGHRSNNFLAYIDNTNLVFKLDVNDKYYDNWGNDNIATINAYYRTKWVDLGEPAIKKRWRRMEAVMQVDESFELPVVSFAEYDSTVTVKNFKFVATGSPSSTSEGVWDDPASDWDDATWATSGGIAGSVDRGANLGVARAVSLKVGGQVTSIPTLTSVGAPVFWGVDALIFKFVPRRVR